MKIRTNIKAGGISLNHNAARSKAGGPRLLRLSRETVKKLDLKTGIRAGYTGGGGGGAGKTQSWG